jgi:hypothetical protein
MILLIFYGLFQSQTNHKYIPFFLQYHAYIKTQFERKIKCFQCDNGKEYDNALFHKFCEVNGMSFRFSCSHTTPQNGKAERKIRTINNII